MKYKWLTSFCVLYVVAKDLYCGTKHITIRLDEKEILLGKDLPERVPEIKDEATFPEKLAAFFMMQK